MLVHARPPHMRQCLDHKVARVGVFNGLSSQLCGLSHNNLRCHRVDNPVGDFVLAAKVLVDPQSYRSAHT